MKHALSIWRRALCEGVESASQNVRGASISDIMRRESRLATINGAGRNGIGCAAALMVMYRLSSFKNPL